MAAGDIAESIAAGEEGIDDIRVEMPAASGCDDVAGFMVRHRLSGMAQNPH